ncbi:MAG: efflux RND transporter periplasmic adaptor subunit [Cellvibrionales bacterium TMED148]|nr:efflux transporter periplasmic adaptor subunit [Porticoccaceae bacterium]RPG88595.1 MAG: efflux RND transporter periplasmic adaptor subunit [Cellvibrionales bacterium TMED148]
MIEKKTTITLSVLSLGLFLIWALVYLRPAPEQIERPKPSPLNAAVMEASLVQHRVEVFSQGTVVPKRQVQLVAQVSGQIKSVSDNFADGAFFSDNELLIQIEPIDYELAFTIADAAVANAEERVAIEKGLSRQAKREWRDLGDEQANNLFLRKPQLNAAKANLASAKAELKRAKLSIKRTSIRGAFDGRIESTLANVGQFVTPGTALASVYAIDVAEVRLPLTEHQAELIDLPSGRQIPSRDDLPIVEILGGTGNSKHLWKGVIVRTEASIDVRNRMIYAVAEFTDPYPSSAAIGFPPLEVGRFVEAKVTGKILNDVVALPRHCIYRSTQVLSVSKKNTIHFTEVQILQLTEDMALVRGIEERMRIVVSPITDPYEGMAISPSPPPIAPAILTIPSPLDQVL